MLSNKKFFFLVSALASYCFIQSNITIENDYLQIWKTQYIDQMTLQEKQMLANIIHLLHANSIVEYKVRQFLTPITRLNQSIKNDIDQYKNIQENVTTLKTLLDRLAIIIGTRLIYNQTLNAGIDYYNKNTVSIIDEALQQMQLYAQVKLRNWANENENSFNELLKKSSENLSSTIQHFQEISQLHQLMSEGKLPLEEGSYDLANKSLVKLSTALEHNSVSLSTISTAINTLNETNDHATQIVLVGTEIYKEFYTIIYEALMSSDKNYAKTLFSMHGLLPEEYTSILPPAHHVFEYMLQTTKMYTQIEFHNHNEKVTHE